MFDFDKYNDETKNRLKALLHRVYFLSRMKKVCFCGNKSLAKFVGKSLRSTCRYLRILEDEGFIVRENQHTRKRHIIPTGIAKAYCEPSYRKMSKPSKKGDSLKHYYKRPLGKVGVHNKTILANTSNKHNCIPVGSNTLKSQEVLKRIHLISLDTLLKYVQNLDRDVEEIKNEVIFSVVLGDLRFSRKTGSYMPILDGIRIAVHLIKEGRWDIPKGYKDPRTDDLIQKGKEMTEICDNCKQQTGDVKKIDIKNGIVNICPDCYFKEFDQIEVPFHLSNIGKKLRDKVKGVGRNKITNPWDIISKFRANKFLELGDADTCFCIEAEAIVKNHFKYSRPQLKF